MSDTEQSHFEVVLYLGRKAQQPEIIGHGCPLLSHAVSHLFLRKVAFLYQPLIAHCDLDRVQILSLDVFHDGHFQHSLVIGITDICRNHVHSGDAASLKTAFTADNLISVRRFFPDGDRLDQSERLDGYGKFLQRILIK